MEKAKEEYQIGLLKMLFLLQIAVIAYRGVKRAYETTEIPSRLKTLRNDSRLKNAVFHWSPFPQPQSRPGLLSLRYVGNSNIQRTSVDVLMHDSKHERWQ